MYISGHLEILDNILGILPNDYFNHEYENVNVILLKHGMKYPDNPCGIYDNIDNKHVMLRESKLCKFKNIKLKTSHSIELWSNLIRTGCFTRYPKKLVLTELVARVPLAPRVSGSNPSTYFEK